MSTNIFIYLERQVRGSWLFEGERTENIDYDPEDPRDQPEYGPEPLFFEVNRPLHYLFGLPVDTIIEGPSLPFGRRGLPSDVSAELGRWAKAAELNRFHGWCTARELDAFDWNAVTTVRRVVEREHLRFYRDYIENSVVSGMAIDWSNIRAQRSQGPVTPRDWPSRAPDVFADVTWRPSYADMAGYDFMDEVVRKLGRRYGPSEMIRIICWFN